MRRANVPFGAYDLMATGKWAADSKLAFQSQQLSDLPRFLIEEGKKRNKLCKLWRDQPIAKIKPHFLLRSAFMPNGEKQGEREAKG
jgi:hypothetical protein